MYKKIIAAAAAVTMVFSFAAGAVTEMGGSDVFCTASAEVGTSEFIDTAHDVDRASFYTNAPVGEDEERPSFKMSGRTFYQGFTIQSGGTISFNAEGVSTLDLTIGHIDDSQMDGSNVEILFDGNKYADFEIPAHTDLLDYHIDVTSGTKIVTFKLTTSRYSSQQFGFANVSANGEEVPSYTSPQYASNYEIVKGFYNKGDNVKIYDDPQNSQFMMNGRTYYQGVEFHSATGASVNVDDIKTLSFTIGHKDGTGRENGELLVYVDGKVYEKVPLNWNMKELEYELDVSKAKEVYLYCDVDRYRSSSYCIAEVQGDSLPVTKKNDQPTYADAAAFVKSGFNTVNHTAYDGTTTLGCDMSGRSYHQGVVFTHDGGVTFNVDNVKKLSFDLGHVDESSLQDGKLTIYADNKTIGEYQLTYNMPVENITLDVSKYSNVRFYYATSYSNGSKYMLGDITIDGKKPERPCDIPEYDEAADFIRSAYNQSSDLALHDGKNKIGFELDGKDVYQGVVMGFDGHAAFNTENVGKVTFKAGHVNNTGSKSGKLEIYLDNKLKQTIDIQYGTGSKEYTINVNKAKSMYVVCTGGYSWDKDKFAMANIRLEAPFDEPDAVLGDVNEDDNIDIEDAVMIINHINAVKELNSDEFRRADVNQDNNLDIEDAVMIINHINGVSGLD